MAAQEFGLEATFSCPACNEPASSVLSWPSSRSLQSDGRRSIWKLNGLRSTSSAPARLADNQRYGQHGPDAGSGQLALDPL